MPFAQNDRATVPVVISLRRTIRGNRTWEEEARITLSVIFRSTVLGTLANVFWNTRRAYLPWHEYHGVSFISPRCQKFSIPLSLALSSSLCHPLSVSWQSKETIRNKIILNFAEVVKDSFMSPYSQKYKLARILHCHYYYYFVNELINIRRTIIFSVIIARRVNHLLRYNDQMTRAPIVPFGSNHCQSLACIALALPRDNRWNIRESMWQADWIINNFQLQWMQIKLVSRYYVIIVFFVI